MAAVDQFKHKKWCRILGRASEYLGSGVADEEDTWSVAASDEAGPAKEVLPGICMVDDDDDDDDAY